jgi:hypothetical protein
MNRTLAIAALAAFAFAGSLSPALALDWNKQSTVTTSRGTYTHQSQGSCSSGSCSHSGVTTGPNGGTSSNTGTVTKTGPGSFDYSNTHTGPKGNTVTRSGSVTRSFGG